MSISTYSYKSEQPTNSASLVELVNAGVALLQEIKPNTEFGKIVMKSGGETLQTFFNDLSKIFDDYWVSDTMSANYKYVDDLWFKEREIRGTYEPLSRVTLVPFTEILLKQIRNRLYRFKNNRVQSEFTSDLAGSLTMALNRFPDQQEKTISVKSKQQNKNGEYESRNVTFFVEPFVDSLKKGFSEGAKAQRDYKAQQNKETKIGNDKVPDKK